MAPGYLVERCPFCGLEHDAPVGGACQACGTPLRTWCRRHGRETGWMDGPACPRCADEASATRSARSLRAQYATPTPAARDAANAMPVASSPAPRREADAQRAAGGTEPDGWRGRPWRLHYLLKLTLFLTGFGAACGAVLGLMGEGWGSHSWVFIEGGIIGGLFASVLGALTWLVERRSGKRK